MNPFKSKLMVLCCMYAATTNSTAIADEIFFTNGDNVKTEILDTTGCEIKILRKGNTVEIMKKLLEKIVWKSDTISLVGYVCAKKATPVIRFQDTPEYRLAAFLDHTGELGQTFNENSKVAFLYGPLQGNCNSEEFAGIQTAIFELIKKKADVSFLSPSDMLSEISSEKHVYDYEKNELFGVYMIIRGLA